MKTVSGIERGILMPISQVIFIICNSLLWMLECLLGIPLRDLMEKKHNYIYVDYLFLVLVLSSTCNLV